MSDFTVRVYPIKDPKSSLVAFANATYKEAIAISGIRIIEGEKGTFVSMPQTKDAKGEYRDIAYPVTADLRKDLNAAVLGAYEHEREAEPEPQKQQDRDDR
jgi:stage V sporulation protein G